MIDEQNQYNIISVQFSKTKLEDIKIDEICSFFFNYVINKCNAPCLTCGYNSNGEFWSNAWFDNRIIEVNKEALCVFNGRICINCSQQWVSSEFIHNTAMSLIKAISHYPEVELPLMKTAYQSGFLLNDERMLESIF